MKNKLTVTRGEGERGNMGKKGKGHQGTCIKDPWTTWVGLRMGGAGGWVGENGGRKMETTVLEQQ